jgi:hypothetical protein
MKTTHNITTNGDKLCSMENVPLGPMVEQVSVLLAMLTEICQPLATEVSPYGCLRKFLLPAAVV